jgi:predicted 3-demethylubiquinone-9 3-methyltransferase (glyoxalase superfamily)
MKSIVPCLWFGGNAEEAVQFYGNVFPDLRITHTSRYTKAGQEIHGMQEGAILTITFEIHGQAFTALNATPIFKFNEAVSFQIFCDTQEEIDYYWTRLGEGGDPSAQQCGWLKDKFGLSWQVVPSMMNELFESDDPAVPARVMTALLKMKKLDIAALRQAREAEGK